MHKAQMAAQADKEITERMIKSIMPPLFTHVFGKPEEFKKSVNCVHQMRPLFIYPVNELSILFADIVGFTRMSSTKTAEQLVFLLNDLYGRFDRLCEQAGCEKISTLGDCYYCVSGCLNGRRDHANCCVEMGLLMVKEIEKFNQAHDVDVNMRVGVHTGNALCGFIGGKRFRFDVWSGDVTLANKMESSGRAGWVHISEDTYKCLDGKYNTEVGEKYSGRSTYFVIRETKRETVADALKQNPTFGNNNNNMSGVNAAALADDEIAATVAAPTTGAGGGNIGRTMSTRSNHHRRAGSKKSASSDHPPTAANSGGNDVAAAESARLLDNNGGASASDESGMLLLAVKNAQFFKPDVNIMSMRFARNSEESAYQSYLMGASSSVQPSSSSSSSSSLVSYWTDPHNTLFLSILVSFVVNLCVSTGYLLAFVATTSAAAAVDYRLADDSSYQRDVCIMIVGYVALVAVYLLACLVKAAEMWRTCAKNKKRRQHQHQQQQQQAENNNNNNNNNNNHLSRNSSAGETLGVRGGQKSSAATTTVNKSKSCLLYSLAVLLLGLMPLYVLATGAPITKSILAATWQAMLKLNTTVVGGGGASQATPLVTAQASQLNIFSVYLLYALVVSLIHFGSFVQLSSLLKTAMCAVFGLACAVLALVGVQSPSGTITPPAADNNNLSSLAGVERLEPVAVRFATYLFVGEHVADNAALLVDVLLLVFFVWTVNRQSELVLRLSFKCDQDAKRRVTYAHEQKELANWLIEVVLPAHVVGHIKEKQQYSRNYDCVGVLFVSLCNFWEFFEESYEGGRELLRVLNEITVDFDRLFDEPRYKNVEKIKSIGSTFMIASGLNPELADAGNKHLYDLVDFALELNEKLEAFNNEAMSVCHFKFQMRIGFNCGPVTAGVIGTDRLLYDIWGDTVNVASRMDSTGQAGLLQTPKEVVELLKDTYTFFYRGQVQIKGKDQMTTYFMNPKDNKKSSIAGTSSS